MRPNPERRRRLRSDTAKSGGVKPTVAAPAGDKKRSSEAPMGGGGKDSKKAKMPPAVVSGDATPKPSANKKQKKNAASKLHFLAHQGTITDRRVKEVMEENGASYITWPSKKFGYGDSASVALLAGEDTLNAAMQDAFSPSPLLTPSPASRKAVKMVAGTLRKAGASFRKEAKDAVKAAFPAAFSSDCPRLVFVTAASPAAAADGSCDDQFVFALGAFSGTDCVVIDQQFFSRCIEAAAAEGKAPAEFVAEHISYGAAKFVHEQSHRHAKMLWRLAALVDDEARAKLEMLNEREWDDDLALEMTSEQTTFFISYWRRGLRRGAAGDADREKERSAARLCNEAAAYRSKGGGVDLLLGAAAGAAEADGPPRRLTGPWRTFEDTALMAGREVCGRYAHKEIAAR